MTWRFEWVGSKRSIIWPGLAWEQAIRLFTLFANTTGDGGVCLYGEER